jgi:hypothetical protein
MHYLYFPFRDYQDDNQYVGTRKRYENKYGWSNENKHGESNQQVFIPRGKGLIGRKANPLSIVRENDVLIIMGHGSSVNRSTISVKQGNTYKGKSHNRLADQLRSEGLSKRHKVIKLVSCYAGGDLTIDVDNHRWKGDYGEGYFAQLLAKALGKRGYTSVIVGGCAGPMRTCRVGESNKVFYKIENDSGNLYPTDPDGEHDFETKDRVCWFNSEGVQTRRNG